LLLALPLLDENRGIIRAEEIARLPPGEVIVNVAREPHIDTDALVNALESGHLGGAGLGVTDPEPLTDVHPLWSTPNEFISPRTPFRHSCTRQRRRVAPSRRCAPRCHRSRPTPAWASALDGTERLDVPAHRLSSGDGRSTPRWLGHRERSPLDRRSRVDRGHR